MLAIELGRRGVPIILLEEKTSPARFPAANATQARTMEHYRRLGFAEKVRAQGLPPDYPTDIAYFTRYTKHELARFSLPSARAAREIVRTLTGSWSAAELPHRVSQMFVEDVLRAEAAACPSVSIRPGWRMTAVRDTGTGVEVDAEHDGGAQRRCAPPTRSAPTAARSPTRKALGYGYVGESGVVRDFMGGRMFAIHFRSPDALRRHPASARLDVLGGEPRPPRLHGERQRPRRVQLPHPAPPGQQAEQITDARSQGDVPEALAAPLDIEIIARSAWNAGYTLVAEKFQRGRIFLGGDAAHLFTPTGGLGYNTAVEDAVNLGWKLAAVLKGWGGPACSTPTKPNGRRSPGATPPTRAALPTRSDCSCRRRSWRTTAPAGEAARQLTGDHFNHHARFEFNIPGITFGGRYDGSPIVVSDGTAPPPDAANTYQPDRLPRRPRAASVARRRPLALRHVSASSSRCCGLAPSPPTPRRSAPQPRR